MLQPSDPRARAKHRLRLPIATGRCLREVGLIGRNTPGEGACQVDGD